MLLLGLVLGPLLAHEGPGFWGAGICHRIDERSFFAGDQQLPLCARCTGIYVGFLAVAGVSFLRGRRRPSTLPPPGILAVLFLFLLIVGADGLNSYLAFFPSLPHLYEPHNALRLFTGTLEGVALAGLLLPILHMSMWRTPQEVPSIPNLRELGLIVLAAGVVGLLPLWHPPASYYPLVVLNLAGLLLALGTVNSLLVLVVTRRAGRVTRREEAATLFLWGCLLALLEMAALAWLRYSLLGSYAYSLVALR